MFGKIKNKDILKIDDLVKIVREAHLSNASIEEIHSLENSKMFKIRFEKFNITDLVKVDGFSDEEEHNIEINLIDGTKDITVYKSPTLLVHIDDFVEPKVYSISREKIKNEKVVWSHEGQWCTCITDKITALGLEIKNIKLNKKIADNKEKEAKIEEQNRTLNYFNNLFSDDK